MPAIKQHFYEEIFHQLRNLKNDKDKDQFFVNSSLKMIRSLNFDVYNNIINMEFLNKIEVVKQYKQPVMDSENVDFCGSVIHKIQELKIMTRVIVYESNPELLYDYLYLGMTIYLIILKKMSVHYYYW